MHLLHEVVGERSATTVMSKTGLHLSPNTSTYPEQFVSLQVIVDQEGQRQQPVHDGHAAGKQQANEDHGQQLAIPLSKEEIMTLCAADGRVHSLERMC